jgi:hypothetical protein
VRRYAKPFAVADDLDLLRGRTAGVVTLPRHLDWSGSADYDLDSPGFPQLKPADPEAAAA